VTTIVRALPSDAVVVSGGCRGIDSWAAEAARAAGLRVEELLPDLSGVRSRGEAARRYHDRNTLVAQACDELIALVANDRKGGTEDTVRKAVAAGKPVTIVATDGSQQRL
jgi:predicted Rossmann fold nucleotide-binding protein DprA/Smf involved in DNA uptake